MRAIYAWTLKWAESKYAIPALFALAVSESFFFPVPVDALLIPIAVARPKKAFFLAFVTLVGSIIGAYLGYLIGYGLYESVGTWIIETYSLEEFVNTVIEKYQENAFFAIFAAAFSPIPFKVFTITAGAAKINLVTLTFASVIGRGLRFFAVAGLIRVFGKKVKEFIEKYFDFIALIAVVLLIGGFVLLRLI